MLLHLNGRDTTFENGESYAQIIARAMPEVTIANCRVHLRDTTRDDGCNCHSDVCSEAEALERRTLHHDY